MGLENFKTNIDVIQKSTKLVAERKIQLLTHFMKDIEFMYLNDSENLEKEKHLEAQQLIQTIQLYLKSA